MVTTTRRLLEGEVRWAPATWAMPVTLVLALLGLGLSTYLTIEHFTGSTSLACVNGISNCLKVTTSGESYFLGIPVAVLGLCQYASMVALCTPWAWRATARAVHLARLVLAVVGMGFVIWLITAEVTIIHAICLYCTGVHIVTFCLFVAVVRTVPVMLGWADR